MERSAFEGLDQARSRLARDFRTMIADGEDLLKAAASASGEELTAAKVKFEAKLQSARATLADASQPAIDKTVQTAATTDRYVRGNAWTAVGVAIAAGVLIGLLAGRR